MVDLLSIEATAVGVDACWDAVGRGLKDEMRGLVGGLLLTHLPLVADHWFVRAVLIHDELSLVGRWTDH